MSTDRDTTRIVRSWLRTDEHQSADHVLDAVLERLDTTPQRRASGWPARRLPETNSAARLALVATAAAAVLLVVSLTIFPTPDVATSPTPHSSGAVSPMPTPAPQTPTPTLDGAGARRWPNSQSNLGREYGAGLYYWEGQTAWMHNGYQEVGEGEGVSMTFALSDGEHQSGPTAVTVAGLDGTYQELSAGGIRKQVWIFDVEDETVIITVELQPKSTAEEVAEARAIVDSMQVEPANNNRGWRLLFTLPSGWDSG